MLVALALVSIAAVRQEEAIANGGFDRRATEQDPLPCWTLSIGARNGGDETLSEVALDRELRRSGASSLHFSASRTTYAFQIVSQEVEARPGGTYQLTAFARTQDVLQQVNAEGIQQFDNCYVALFLFDGNGELVAREVKTPTRPTNDDWEELSLRVRAPATVRRAEVKLFLSVSGDLWFDDLTLSIEGGEPLPEPLLVFRDDFEGLSELPPAWIAEEGARNGGASPVSTAELVRDAGAGKSRCSLHLAGDARTLLWHSVHRTFEARPGDEFTLSAQVKAEAVRQERNALGIEQFANMHLRLAFLDDQGTTLGAPRYAHPGFGDYDWRAAGVHAVAPQGATRGRVGIFLSVSGDVWIDDVELTRRTGGVPAYDGWRALETAHLVIRHPADHPLAAGIEAYGERMEHALAGIADTLGVRVDEPITVFLYRDKAQGEALTGRPLAFAEPERRAVHQDATNTLGHELTHVVALQLGYAQTGLFGEGIAVWLDGTPPSVHHERASALLESGELPPLDALLADFRGQERGYPAAGSFCGWLLETHGLAAMRALYPRKDLDAAARATLGRGIAELDTDWRAFLSE